MAQGDPGRFRPRISWRSALQGWYVVTLTHRPPLTSGKSPVLIFRGSVDPQGTWFCRYPRDKSRWPTSPGFDPGTARLVAQCLNNCATPICINALLKHIFFYWRYNPLCVCILQPSRGAIASSRTRFLNHTQRRATVSRTSLDESLLKHINNYILNRTFLCSIVNVTCIYYILTKCAALFKVKWRFSDTKIVDRMTFV